jgi:hypothetical protein
MYKSNNSMRFFEYKEGRIFICSMKYLVMFMSLLIFLSCGSTENEIASPAGGLSRAAMYKIELSPSYPSKNNAITAKVKSVNPSDLAYQWFVNDREIQGATDKVFKYPGLKKRDRIQVKVSIKNQGEVLSKPVVISNTLPQIRNAKMVPKTPQKGEELRVETQTSDEDNDSVRVIYEWFINGEQEVENTDTITIDGTSIKRGDRVSVKLTPSDGDGKGNPITLHTIVANSPPHIMPDIPANFKGSVYNSKVKAQDPDNDPLTFTLKHGPEGMTIDPQSGLITWEVSEKDNGKHHTTISVNDGQGGETLVTLNTEINVMPSQ